MARAMWKGVIRFAAVRVPVKVYAAVEDRGVHFRLLHAKDQAPVRQVLINPNSDREVPYQEARRAFATAAGDLVLLKDEELAAVEPLPSRDIEILRFLPQSAIDHRWYLRPYYLGPDEGGTEAWLALIEALGHSGLEGLARWVMRNKEYLGALRLHQGYPMLIALRHADEVVALTDLEAPAGAPLDTRELVMAHQLVGMLAGDFEPESYSDQFRARVEQLIQTKASGGKVRALPVRKRQPAEDLTKALEASLTRERRRA